jgi:hypothetical protein
VSGNGEFTSPPILKVHVEASACGTTVRSHVEEFVRRDEGSSSATGVSKSGGRIERTISFLAKRCARSAPAEICGRQFHGCRPPVAPAGLCAKSFGYLCAVSLLSRRIIPDRVSSLELFFDLVFVFDHAGHGRGPSSRCQRHRHGNRVDVLLWMFSGYA